MSSVSGPLIPFYGYVPFKYFQYVVLATEFALIYNYKEVNEYLDKHYFDQSYKKQQLKQLLLLVPLLLLCYYDIRYSSFSLKNLGVPPDYNDPLNQVLNIVGSYALIHIFAQDTGLSTPILQRDMIQTHLLFILTSIGMAYSVTRNRSQSMIALLFYYHFKYVYSGNI